MATAATIAARSFGLVGTVLTGIPLAAPIVLTVAFAIAAGGLRMDYLIPGELFAFVAAGAALTIVASIISHRQILVVSILTAVTILLFFCVGWVADATGLASGRTSGGWPLVLVSILYAAYVLAVVALFVAGILLCHSLFSARAARASKRPA